MTGARKARTRPRPSMALLLPPMASQSNKTSPMLKFVKSHESQRLSFDICSSYGWARIHLYRRKTFLQVVLSSTWSPTTQHSSAPISQKSTRRSFPSSSKCSPSQKHSLFKPTRTRSWPSNSTQRTPRTTQTTTTSLKWPLPSPPSKGFAASAHFQK